MSMTPLPTKAAPYASFNSNALQSAPTTRMPSFERRSRSGGRHDERADRDNARQSIEVDGIDYGVKIYPSDIVKRRAVSSHGMAAEIVQATKRDKIECRFRGPVHLLALYYRGVRQDGGAFAVDVPGSARSHLTPT